MLASEPVAAYVQHVHVPLEPFPEVLHTLVAVLPPDPHVQLELALPDCAVSEVAASVAWVASYVPTAVQS